MDKIIIKNLEIYGYHGVFEDEKRNGQKFFITVELSLDTRKAGVSDDLSASVHYGELAIDIEREFLSDKFDLIERVAEYIAHYILVSRKLVRSVKVLLKKPFAPIGKPLDYVAVEIERGRHTAYIALGSNLGDRQKLILSAIDEINNAKAGVVVKQKSSLIETDAFGGVAVGKFINATIEVETLLTAEELLKYLQNIENKLGRVREKRWGDRSIDLDILLYDDLVTNDATLVIPHPEMQNRDFVLLPLGEIANNVVHPIYKVRIRELIERLKVKS